MKNYLFQSERLGFRSWEDTDILPFAEMNAEEKVMEFFPNTLSLTESRELVATRLQAHFQQHGFCFYAVDRLADEEFLGFIGFACPSFQSFFTPCVEIGWRLKSAVWNQGYATEGAKACLDYGFSVLGFKEVHSFTAVLNKRSEHIMQKIGMEKVGEFEHPLLNVNSPLSLHVLYKIQSPSS